MPTVRTTSDPREIFRAMKMPKDSRTLCLTTTNATVKANGGLVMGRGHAKMVRDTYPGVDVELANAVRRQVVANVAAKGEGEVWRRLSNKYILYGDYHLLVSRYWPQVKLGAFQVKRVFSEQADLELIEKSSLALLDFIRTHGVQRVDLPFPGIGNGKLSRAEVAPILQILPDNVRLWILE